ncbi:MAG: hypothetical protein WD757_02085 [Actinomycetota bacterium]
MGMRASPGQSVPGRREYTPPPPVKPANSVAGVFFALSGIVAGLIAVARFLTLAPAAIERFVSASCQGPEPTPVEAWTQVGVCALAAFLALFCAEMAARREARPRMLGVIASVLGIFALFGAGLLGLEILIPQTDPECLKAVRNAMP